MFLKILVTLVLLVVAWTVATRLTGAARPRRAHKPAHRAPQHVSAEKLVKCPGCGIYLPASQTCDCRDRA